VIEWNGVPVIRFSAVTITPMEHLVKRILDIILSGIFLILLSPIFLVIALLIYFEDPSGPIIFRNRRVGLSGNHFTLYKFRYMYWKYCVKDAYGKEDDEALRYETELREKQSSREGPVYKIADDPRKTRVGTVIEKYSLDELPQLINVLIGNMSLV
jgi:lipopolysaccharide/colanic/teichoic acid biosynthesis glycosyltransferase